MTQRLPVPGQDDGVWGDILNGFLGVSHNADGTLQLSAITSSGGYAKPSSGIPASDLDSSTQTIINSVASKYVKPASGIPKSDLASSVQTSLTSADNAIQSGSAAGGDLVGSTYPNPIVAKLNGITLPSSAPAANQVLTATSSTATTWSTPAAGVALDTTASDIQPLGTRAAGATGKAADAGHVHAMPSLDQINTPVANVSMTTGGTAHKITGLANGTSASDAAAFGQIPVAGATAGTYAAGNDSRITGAIQTSTATTKGDLLVATGSSAITRRGVGSDGQVLTADSTQTDGMKWATPTPTVPLRSTWWYPMDGGGGNRTMTYQLLWVFPFDCQKQFTMTSIGCNVKTAGTAGSTIRIGIFSSDGAGLPGAVLLDAGTVAGDTTGVKSVSISQLASPDRLWFGAVWQGTNSSAPVLQAYAHAAPYLGWSSFYQFPSVVGYQYSGITGALSNLTGVTPNVENNNVPAVQFQVQ